MYLFRALAMCCSTGLQKQGKKIKFPEVWEEFDQEVFIIPIVGEELYRMSLIRGTRVFLE
jgi:hypothetical protein